MNFNKTKFTLAEFAALPVFESARGAPIGVPFLLEGRMSKQQEYLQDLLDEHTEEGLFKKLDEEAKKTRKDTRLKVQYWTKYKDGNVQDRGATIFLAAKGLNLKDDTLIINTGA